MTPTVRRKDCDRRWGRWGQWSRRPCRGREERESENQKREMEYGNEKFLQCFTI